MSATIAIGAMERDTLHWLMARRLFILGQDPPELARSEGVGLDELSEEFSEDLRLMMDIGFEIEDDREAVDLTMPVPSLVKTIRRLRRDARRAPIEPRREHDPQGDDEGRWQRFREAVEVCDEVLDLLDSPHDEAEEGVLPSAPRPGPPSSCRRSARPRSSFSRRSSGPPATSAPTR